MTLWSAHRRRAATVVAAGALVAVLLARGPLSPDGGAQAQTATRTIRVEKVLVDTLGIAPPSSFSGTISNAPSSGTTGAWSVTTADRTVDFVVPRNLEHVVTEAAPPGWSGWSLGGYKHVAIEFGCGTSGFGFSTTHYAVPPGTGDRKICVRNTFSGGVVRVGVVVDPASSPHGAAAFGGTFQQGSSATTHWSATPGGWGGWHGFAAGSYTATADTLPAGWEVTGWATGSVAGDVPSCPTAASAYTPGPSAEVAIAAGQRAALCLMVRYEAPRPTMGALIIGAVRDARPGVPGADGVSLAGMVSGPGPTAATWGPVGLGAFGDPLALAPGPYQASVSQSGRWQLVGWAAGWMEEGAPSCPSDPLAFGAADPLPVTIGAEGPVVACAMVTRRADLPTLSVTRHPVGIVDGFAHWHLVIGNAEPLEIPIELELSGAELDPGANAPCEPAGPARLRCTVPAEAALELTLRAAVPPPACRAGAMNVAIEGEVLPPVRDERTRFGSAGGTEATAYELAGNASACRPPTIAKRPAGDDAVEEPAGVAWTVTVANPDAGRVILLRDAAAGAAGLPAFDPPGSGSCDVATSAAAFAAALAGDGVTCALEADARLAFAVAPAEPPPRTCADQPFANRATIEVLEGPGTGATFAAEAVVTLLGDPDRCERELVILAGFLGGPLPGPESRPTPTFDPPVPAPGVPERCEAVEVPGSPAALRWSCRVPATWSGAAMLPTPGGWEACAAAVPGEPATVRLGFCRLGAVTARIVVANVPADPAQFTVRLTAPTVPRHRQAAAFDGSAPLDAVFEKLPTGLPYVLELEPLGGYRSLGWHAAGPDGSCTDANTNDLLGLPADLGVLGPGAVLRICLLVVREASVVVDKGVAPAEARPGGTLTWQIAVTIEDAPLPESIALTDPLPVGFDYVQPAADAPFACQFDGLTLGCALPAGTAPGRYAVTIAARIPASDFSRCGEHRNAVTYSVGTAGGSDGAVALVSCEQTAGSVRPQVVVLGPAEPGHTFPVRLSGPTGEHHAWVAPAFPAAFDELPAGTFAVTALPRDGYRIAGSAFAADGGGACPASPASAAATLSVAIDAAHPVAVPCFYYEPLATIRVEKVVNVVGVEGPGAGWEFTLSGCGIEERRGVTGPDGTVAFDDLPPAAGCSYTVSETLQPGWTAVTLSQSARPAGGETVTLRFLNIRDFDPPCVDPADPRCLPLELPPPPPPAAPATPAPPAPIENPAPAATVAPTTPPAPSPTAVSGGVSLAPTPRPPAAGSGAPDNGRPLVLLLAAGGVLALGSGTLLLLAATPARRRR